MNVMKAEIVATALPTSICHKISLVPEMTLKAISMHPGRVVGAAKRFPVTQFYRSISVVNECHLKNENNDLWT